MSTAIDQASVPQSNPPAMPSNSAAIAGVLILCYEFPPENVVGALRPYRFAKFLPEHGIDATVITATQSPRSANRAAVFSVADPLRRGPGVARAFVRRLALIPLELAAFGADNLSLFWSRRLVEKAEAIISGTRIDAVISTFPPIATHLAAYRLKRRYPHLKWIADFRDPFTGNPTISRREAFWHRKLEQLFFENADVLIANTDAAAERWQQLYPNWKDKVTCLWNGFDPDEQVGAAPIPQRPYKLMSHAGEIYAGRHPNALLDSLVRLIDSKQIDPAAFRLHLVGEFDPSAMPNTRSQNSLIASGCLVITPRRIRAADADQITAESDFLLLLDWTGKSGGLQVPYKLYSYLRVGRPIVAITNRQSPVDRILSRAGIPYICLYPDESPEQLDAKVIELLRSDSTPKAASTWFSDNFDGRKQVSRLAALVLPTALV